VWSVIFLLTVGVLPRLHSQDYNQNSGDGMTDGKL